MGKRKGTWSNWNGPEKFNQRKWEKHAAKFEQDGAEMMGHKELQSFRIQLLKELETLGHPHKLAEIPTLEDGTQDILDRAHAEHEKSLFFHL